MVITTILLYTNAINRYIARAVAATLLCILAFCSQKEYPVSLSGTLVSAGITSYQYGSHQLISNDSLYALRSSTLQMEEFENKKVSISGRLVSGYPLEGGPALIEVSRIELIKTID